MNKKDSRDLYRTIYLDYVTIIIEISQSIIHIKIQRSIAMITYLAL